MFFRNERRSGEKRSGDKEEKIHDDCISYGEAESSALGALANKDEVSAAMINSGSSGKQRVFELPFTPPCKYDLSHN